MESRRPRLGGRLTRLADELAEEGIPDLGSAATTPMILDELDYALRPPQHERRVPTYGAFIAPNKAPDDWQDITRLSIRRRPIADIADDASRRFADGLSSWALREEAGITELLAFDRAASSERDLVVLADASGSAVVQRHPSGTVRLAGEFGVVRWDGVRWQHEPPLGPWIETVTRSHPGAACAALSQLLKFAVYDLGSRGIGALIVVRPDGTTPATWELRLPTPPPLDVTNHVDLAPLHHVLAQTDGAAVFDDDGVLRRLGVRLVPSADAEADIDPLRGTRHTAARRYSYDDPDATIIAVSEDGPVTVLRNGTLIARSPH